MGKRSGWLSTVFVLLLCLAACATGAQWVQEGKGAGDFDRDHKACEAGAMKDVYGTMTVNTAAYDECMTGRGWKKP